MVSTQDPFKVHGIHLLRVGDYVTVSVDTGHGWIEVIREFHDGSFSHIVEPNGIRAAIATGGGRNVKR